MQIGHWQLDSINGGNFWLDGGVVFGIVPKPLWSKVVTPDENNRIPIRSHCILARNAHHTVLIDTGYGTKYSPLDRRFYAMESGDPLQEGLAALDVTSDEIDLVVLSHLHFDHAGGATVYNSERQLVPRFPRARHIIGRSEWDAATSRAPELQTAYPIENIAPLETAGVINLIDDNAEIVPGLRAQLTGGHTRGHQALVFESAGQGALCIGDLCPTANHLHPMWNLSYDTYPLETRRVKPALLAQATERDWWMVWPHDMQVAAARLEAHPKRGFMLLDARLSL